MLGRGDVGVFDVKVQIEVVFVPQNAEADLFAGFSLGFTGNAALDLDYRCFEVCVIHFAVDFGSAFCCIESIRLKGRHIIGKNRYGKNGKKHTDGQNERENFFHNDYLHNIAIPRRVTRHAHLSFIFFV